MRIQIQLSLDGNPVKQEIMEIVEQKLGELTEDEIQSAIEVNIRTWLDRILQVEWEVLEDQD